jgi:hypothetical protein
MKKTNNKSREVYFKIILDVGKTIPSASLEDALEAARAMKPTDIVDLDNLSYNDGDIEVTGVYEISN